MMTTHSLVFFFINRTAYRFIELLSHEFVLCLSFTLTIMFLMETHTSEEWMSFIKASLGFQHMFAVRGVSGGAGLAYF